MSYQDKINEVKKDIQNKNFLEAQSKLEKMLDDEKIKEVEDENYVYYTFNNCIEMLLFKTIYLTHKKIVNIETNISEIYYYLGIINLETKNFEKAIECFDNGLKWNPVDVSIMFEKATTYRMIGELEKYKAEIEKTYQYIYRSSYWAKYFRELGWYYTEKGTLDLANALYTVSLYYANSEMANKELKYIAQRENRKVRVSSKEEIEKLFQNYNIECDFNNTAYQIIYDGYESLVREKPDSQIINVLSRALYDITLNKKFLTYLTLQDKELGIEVKVPEFWKIINKDAYEELGMTKNTIFAFLNDKGQKTVVFCNGKCTREQFDEKYKTIIEGLKEDGINILREFCIRGEKNINQVLYEVNTDKGVSRLIKNYVIANDYLFNITWNVREDMDPDQLLNEINNSQNMDLVWSLKEANNMIFQQNDSAKISEKDNMKAMADLIDQDFERDLKVVIEEFEKNGICSHFTKLLIDFSESVIKAQGIDPFWSKMAINMLETLIILNLLGGDTQSYRILIHLTEQCQDLNMARQICRENIGKLDMNRLKEEGEGDIATGVSSAIDTLKILDNDKTLSSVLELIHKPVKSILDGIGVVYENSVEDKSGESDDLMKKSQNAEIRGDIEMSEVADKPLVLKCPSCGFEFELNWNVPIGEKEFYCKCPNCDSEIKNINPRYRGTDEN